MILSENERVGLLRNLWGPFDNGELYMIKCVYSSKEKEHIQFISIASEATKHLIANFLSFHMGLVIVMHFGAGNELHGIEISMFWFYWTLFYTHIQRYTAAAGTKTVKQCKQYLSRKLLCQGLRKCKIGKYVIIFGCIATSSFAHDFWK